MHRFQSGEVLQRQKERLKQMYQMNRLTLTVNGHMHKYSNRSFSKEEDKIMAIKKKPIPPSAEHEGVIIKDFFDLSAPSYIPGCTLPNDFIVKKIPIQRWAQDL